MFFELALFFFFPEDVETNECLDNNGGCWQDKGAHITACKVKLKTCSSSRCLVELFFLIVYFITFLSYYSGYIPWESM